MDLNYTSNNTDGFVPVGGQPCPDNMATPGISNATTLVSSAWDMVPSATECMLIGLGLEADVAGKLAAAAAAAGVVIHVEDAVVPGESEEERARRSWATWAMDSAYLDVAGELARETDLCYLEMVNLDARMGVLRSFGRKPELETVLTLRVDDLDLDGLRECLFEQVGVGLDYHLRRSRDGEVSAAEADLVCTLAANPGLESPLRRVLRETPGVVGRELPLAARIGVGGKGRVRFAAELGQGGVQVAGESVAKAVDAECDRGLGFDRHVDVDYGWTERSALAVAGLCRTGKALPGAFWQATVLDYVDGTAVGRSSGVAGTVVVSASSTPHRLRADAAQLSETWVIPPGCRFLVGGAGVYPGHSAAFAPDRAVVLTLPTSTVASVVFPQRLYGRPVTLVVLPSLVKAQSAVGAGPHFFTTYSDFMVTSPGGGRAEWVTDAVVKVSEVSGIETWRVNIPFDCPEGAELSVVCPSVMAGQEWLLHGVREMTSLGVGGFTILEDTSEMCFEARQYDAVKCTVAVLHCIGDGESGPVNWRSRLAPDTVTVHLAGAGLTIKLGRFTGFEPGFLLSRVVDDYSYDAGGPENGDGYDRVLWPSGRLEKGVTVGWSCAGES